MKWDFKKWLVKEMTCWKWLGYEMTGKWNDWWMRWLVNEMTGEWNEWLMKWLVNELTGEWND